MGLSFGSYPVNALVYVNGFYNGVVCKDVPGTVKGEAIAAGAPGNLVQLDSGPMIRAKASDLSWRYPAANGEPEQHLFLALLRHVKDVAREYPTSSNPNAAAARDLVAKARALGLDPDETLEERFTRETGHAITPAVEAALAWRDKS